MSVYAELIAEARGIDNDWVLDNSPDDSVEVIRELADALEAAEQRADQAEATAEHLHDEDTREIVALTQERDSAMASYEDYLRIHRERDNWKMSAEEAEKAEKRWERRAHIAERERNQLAAVVEKALSHDPLHGADSGLHCGGMAPCIRDILATAPAGVLREHDAKVRAEAIREYVTAARENPHTYYWPPSGVLDDAEQWADEIEKGTI